ncbi:MAG: hypothetical protein WD512_12080 [Candidatus Paceibacterota bacterium]
MNRESLKIVFEKLLKLQSGTICKHYVILTILNEFPENENPTKKFRSLVDALLNSDDEEALKATTQFFGS